MPSCFVMDEIGNEGPICDRSRARRAERAGDVGLRRVRAGMPVLLMLGHAALATGGLGLLVFTVYQASV
jgi:hypothetical protein